MYYEETWIGDSLFWRSSPNGKWIEFTIADYKTKVRQLEQQVKSVGLAEVGKCYYGVYDENGDLLHVHHSQTGADKYCKALEKMRGYPFYMDEVTVWP